MRKPAVFIGVLVLCIGAFTALAGAHTVKFFTEPHITDSSGYDRDTGLYTYLAGNVESNSPACQAGRTVELRDETKKVIATVKSTGGGHGKWRVDASSSVALAHGHSYYVTVPKRVLKDTPKHLHVCKAGRSKPEDF